jgi:hypothetical protein
MVYYLYLYCLSIVTVGALNDDTTLFVSVPGPSGLRVCILRFDADGGVSLVY